MKSRRRLLAVKFLTKANISLEMLVRMKTGCGSDGVSGRDGCVVLVDAKVILVVQNSD